MEVRVFIFLYAVVVTHVVSQFCESANNLSP